MNFTKQELAKAKHKFYGHRYHAKKRNVAFLLTFDEWITIWINSGHWNERGLGARKYCMCRIDDIGPYAVGNVFIDTNSKNVSDGRSKCVGWAHSESTKKSIGESQFGAKNHMAKPVMADGIYFGSLADAARHLEVSQSTISYRINANYFGYRYL